MLFLIIKIVFSKWLFLFVNDNQAYLNAETYGWWKHSKGRSIKLVFTGESSSTVGYISISTTRRNEKRKGDDFIFEGHFSLFILNLLKKEVGKGPSRCLMEPLVPFRNSRSSAALRHNYFNWINYTEQLPASALLSTARSKLVPNCSRD